VESSDEVARDRRATEDTRHDLTHRRGSHDVQIQEVIVVVLHALFNKQMPLFVSEVPPQWILCVIAIGLIAWIELSARQLSSAGRLA
jgi:hypothetical protein